MPFLSCCSHHRLGWEAPSRAPRPPAIHESALDPTDDNRNATPRGTRRILGLPYPAWKSPWTLLTSHLPSSGLDHLVVDDSDSDDDRPRSSKRFREGLDSVRSRLFQFNSRDHDSRNQSQVSIGNTEEEIARRAELKRLMHQRIQNELFNEQTDDEPNSKASPSISCLSPVASGPRDYIEFSVSALPTLDSPSGLESGPKLTITLPQDECKGTIQQDSVPPEPSLTLKRPESCVYEAIGTVRCLCPELVSTKKVPVSRRGSIPQSIMSQRSFQLSNGTSRLDRILGPDNGFSSRRGSSSVDGHSGLGIWLIAQGLRSRDDYIFPLKDSEDSSSNSQRDVGSHIKEQDTISETPDPGIAKMAQLEMNTAPGQTSSDADQSKCLTQDTNTKHFICSNVGSTRENLPPSQIAISATEENVLDGAALADILSLVADNTSSNYNSKRPSFQQSTSRSQSEFHVTNIQDLQSLKLSPFETNANSSLLCENHTLKNPDPIDFTHSDQSVATISHIKTGGTLETSDPCAVSPSKTASFRQREMELLSIQTRFGDVLSRMKPSIPLTSRFREEISERRLSKTGPSSLIDKIHLRIPRRLLSRSKFIDETDSNSDGCMETKVQRTSHFIRPSSHSLSPHIHVRPSSEQEESATDMWQRAIKRESEERHSSQTGAGVPKVENENCPLPARTPDLGVGLLSGRNSGKNSSFSTDNANGGPSQLETEGAGLRATDHSKRLIQRWVTEMFPGTRKYDQNIQRGELIGFKKPPDSWTMYPSHTREQRTKHASTKDNVTPQDFAIQEIASDGRVFWSTDVEVPQQDMHEQPLTRSLSLRLGKVVKSKLNRFLPLNKEMGDAAVRPRKQRPVSREAKQLEYPELEILPSESGFKELEALEQEIDNLRGKQYSGANQICLGRQIPTKSLGTKISTRMHEVTTPECEDCNKALIAISIPKTPSPPTSHGLIQESIVLTDTFVTPQSRFSLDPSPRLKTPRSETRSKAASSKSDQLVIQALSNDVSLTTIRPQSFTWGYQPSPEFFDSTSQEKFREGPSSHLQKDHSD